MNGHEFFNGNPEKISEKATEEVPQKGDGGRGGGRQQLNFSSWTRPTNAWSTHIPARKSERSPHMIDGEAALLAEVQHICKFCPGMTSPRRSSLLS